MNPYSANPAAKLYKTGDLARWMEDGVLEYLGRNDFQVKIAGNRIEPGEIESVLNTHSSVEKSVVVPITAPSGAKQLAAYLVASSALADPPATSEIRTYLGTRMPRFLIPQHFCWIKSLPMTESGKLDRKALPSPFARTIRTGVSP